MNAARKRSMLFFALVVLAMPMAMFAGNVWMAAGLIGLGLFAHQGFSTNIFGMATDIVPAQRVASVIALGAVAGNIAGMSVIELAGWSLTHGAGYAPMFAIAVRPICWRWGGSICDPRVAAGFGGGIRG
jgi:ACS family hexuronate transporter-like MFS transporter